MIVINVYLLRFCSPVVIGQILVLETLFLQAPKYLFFLEESRQMYSMNRWPSGSEDTLLITVSPSRQLPLHNPLSLLLKYWPQHQWWFKVLSRRLTKGVHWILSVFSSSFSLWFPLIKASLHFSAHTQWWTKGCDYRDASLTFWLKLQPFFSSFFQLCLESAVCVRAVSSGTKDRLIYVSHWQPDERLNICNKHQILDGQTLSPLLWLFSSLSLICLFHHFSIFLCLFF